MVSTTFFGYKFYMRKTESTASGQTAEDINERLGFLLDAAGMGEWSWDAKTNLVTFSQKAAEIFGVREGGTLDWSEIKKLLHAEDREQALLAVQNAIEQKNTYDIEYRIHHTNGSQRWISVKGRPVFDDHGDVKKIVAVIQDITDKKLREQELIIVQESLSLALIGGKMGWWVRDIVTDEVKFSDEMANMFGLEPHEFRGTKEHYFEMLHPEDKVNNQFIIDDAIARGTNFKIEFRFRHKNGHWGWMEGRGRVLQSKYQEHPHLYGIAIDITDRKEVEARLIEASAQSEAASNAKSNFLANMSHEIRTPMNAILGLSNIIERSEPLTPNQKRYISTLKQSGESLLLLINDLLDISKIEASGIEIENIPFRLDLLLDDIVSMMSVRAHEKDISFSMDSTAIEGMTFRGDPTRIRQIITNLCGNAVKFTQQGVITLQVSMLPPVFGVSKIALTVADTGIGIAEDKIDKIFEKFTQADNTISRKFGGTGLGLAISKTLAELMGGEIQVSSVVGTGSEFTVLLPLPIEQNASITAQQKQPANDMPDIPQNKGLVLLVEDYEPNILVARTLLEMFGYDCETASNGRIAVEKATHQRFKAILMDVQMPEVNGIDATKAIRQFEQDNQIPPAFIIGMTAHALAGDKEKCLGAGMNDYMSKPFSMHDLENKLANIKPAKIA